MKFIRIFAMAMLAFGFSMGAMAQQPSSQEQIDRLAALVDLTDKQKDEIRSIVEGMRDEIAELQTKAQELQTKLREQIAPDFDEKQIRKDASALGDLSGRMAALSTLMQAKIDSVFTEQQREELEAKMAQIQAKMQEMQRQRMQQQNGAASQ